MIDNTEELIAEILAKEYGVAMPKAVANILKLIKELYGNK